MTVDDLHDFFVAAASVMGALIGLLFVALSVAQDRQAQGTDGDRLRSVRASASLTAFLNALTISLFGLIPGFALGATLQAVGAVGVTFLLATALFLRRVHFTARAFLDITYLVGLATVFALQIATGSHMSHRPYDPGDLQRLATLVVVCALLGIARAWELIGARSIGLPSQVISVGQDAARRVRAELREHDGRD